MTAQLLEGSDAAVLNAAVADEAMHYLVTYLKRCLHKDPRQRLGDIRDMRLALDGRWVRRLSVTVRGVQSARGGTLVLATNASYPHGGNRRRCCSSFCRLVDQTHRAACRDAIDPRTPGGALVPRSRATNRVDRA
jgi:hypothetical protein